MRALLTRLLLGYVGASGLGAGGHAQDFTPPALPKPSMLSIAVKQTDAARVVYVEHVGGYWTIGPQLARARGYMLKHDQPGSMFVRFLDNPSAVAADVLRSEIGLFATSDHQPNPPYKTAIRPPELVAFMRVPASSATPARHLAMMRRWIEEHGYVSVGPVTEIYPGRDGDNANERGSELQIVIRSPGPQAFEQPPRADRPQFRAPIERARPPESVAKTETVRPVVAREKTAVNRWAGDTGARSLEGTVGAIVADAPEKKPGANVLEHKASLQELVDAARFEQIAARLLPDDRAFSPSLQVWIGQIVFRVAAAAKGIEKVYPGEEQVVTALADAIVRRYRAVSVNFSVDPLDQAVVHIDLESDSHGVEKQAITREVDALLGRVAVKGADPEAALAQLVEILQRVCEVLQSNRS